MQVQGNDFNLSMRMKRRIVKFRQIPTVRKTISYLKQLVLPGFQGVPFWSVMYFFIESFIKGILFQRAAALTYYIFATAIPLLMALVATMSFLGENVKNVLLEFIETIVPSSIWGSVSHVINNLVLRQDGAIVWLTLSLGVYLSFTSLNAIINTLNISYYDVSRRSFLQQLLTSIAMVVTFLITVTSVTLIFITVSKFINSIDIGLIESPNIVPFMLNIAKWALVFMLFYFFVSALFYFTPSKKQDYKFFSAGSMFSTIMTVLLTFGVSIYFSNFSTYNLVYGSIGGVLIILFWIFWSSTIILVGFDLNVSIATAIKKYKNGELNITIKSSVKE